MLDYDRRSNRIAEARYAARLTQHQLAERIGATDNTIQNYEAGRTDPKVSLLVRIANVTGCSLEFLLGVDDGKGGGNLTADEVELVSLFRSLPDRERFRVLGYVERAADESASAARRGISPAQGSLAV